MWEGGIRAFSQKGLFSSASLFMCLSVGSDNLFQIITTLNSPECSLVKGFPGRRVFASTCYLVSCFINYTPTQQAAKLSAQVLFSGGLWEVMGLDVSDLTS